MKQITAAAGKPRTLAYLRVSTADQDLDKFKTDILQFTNNRDFGKVFFHEERVSGRKPWQTGRITAPRLQTTLYSIPRYAHRADRLLHLMPRVHGLWFPVNSGRAKVPVAEGYDQTGNSQSEEGF